MIKGKIATLIIAAGYSSRMHDFKPLLPLGKEVAIKRLVHTYQQYGIEHIYVVTGHNQDKITKALEDENVQIIYNEAYDNGMFSSIQKGLEAMDENIEAFFMHPADIPLVKVATLQSLYEAYEAEHKGIIYPTFLGHKGHPPLISMKYKNNILSSNGEGGLKCVLESLSQDSLHVEVCEQAVLMDMDTPQDYQNLKEYDAVGVPNEQECLAIMQMQGVEEHIIKHCQGVGKMVLTLLNEPALASLNFDKNRLFAAALLHDISRKEKNHAVVGALLLNSLGYGYLSELVETHMDITVDENEKLSEAELLFLADKLVGEDKVCGLEKRFERVLKKCEGNAEALKYIKLRLQAAKSIVKKIETLTKKAFLYG